MEAALIPQKSWDKTHICENLGFFPGISSCECHNFDITKSQLSFVDCLQL